MSKITQKVLVYFNKMNKLGTEKWSQGGSKQMRIHMKNGHFVVGCGSYRLGSKLLCPLIHFLQGFLFPVLFWENMAELMRTKEVTYQAAQSLNQSISLAPQCRRSKQTVPLWTPRPSRLPLCEAAVGNYQSCLNAWCRALKSKRHRSSSCFAFWYFTSNNKKYFVPGLSHILKKCAAGFR